MSPSTSTWSESPGSPGETAVPDLRTTVLPRMSVEGGAPHLVDETRPRFEVLGLLGEGGLGRVVEARDLDIGRRVAIKSIRPDRVSDGALLRFVQEVRIAGRLDHPNIVPVHDVGRDPGGALYFVMKRVDGETLEAIIDRLRAGDAATHLAWTFERRVAVFRQVLHAVAFAHERGVVHRDLKPANVMVGRHGEVQLLDWGVARTADGVDVPVEGGASGPTLAGSLVGTPLYMSPEQARGEPADARSDVWSLCVLFYELLALRHFLADTTTVEVVLSGIRSAPIPNPSLVRSRSQPPVPAELAWYVLAGLQRDPARRFPDVRTMLRRLDDRDEGLFPVQCPLTLQKRVLAAWSRAVDRHPVGLMLLSAGVALASVLFVVGLLSLVVVLAVRG